MALKDFYENGVGDVDRAGLSEGLIFMVIVYLIGMAGLAFRGFLLKRKAGIEGGIEGHMNYHFLAGSDFGPAVLFFNFAAQYIGGIVMVQTPDDTRTAGFWMLMWISGCSWCGATFNVVQCRTREVMRARNYLSPNDYLTDRYRSNWITALGVLVSTFQMVMIIGLEVRALFATMRALLGQTTDRESLDAIVWCLYLFILICEFAGGMASVALTDAVQAGLLVISFFILPCLVTHVWGGFDGIGKIDCQNRQVADTFGYVAGPVFGIVADASLPGGIYLEHQLVGKSIFQAPTGRFGLWGSDSAYKNDKLDVERGVATKLDGFAVTGHACGTAACACSADTKEEDCKIPTLAFAETAAMPNTYFNGMVMAPVPPYLNINFTFGTPSVEGAEVGASRYFQDCHLPMTCSTGPASACKNTTNACPMDGTKHHAVASTVSNMTDTGYWAMSVSCKTNDGDETCTYGRTWSKHWNATGNSAMAAPMAFSGIMQYTTCAGASECNGDVECLADPHTAGCMSMTNEPMFSSQSGCLANGAWSTWFMKYPPREIAMYMFSFGFMWIAFALAPITLHRTMTAQSADGLRKALTILHLFPLTFFLPVILLGATAAAVSPPTTFEAACLPDTQAAENAGCPSAIWPHGSISAFPFIAFRLAEYSGFAAFIVVLAIVSCCASFMSTTDSVVLCGSLLFTVDFYYHLVRKNKAGLGELMVVTKIVSSTMMICGVCMALYSDIDFIEMLNIGNGFLGALVIAYMGMFAHSLKSAEIFVGMITNIIIVMVFQFMRFWPKVDPNYPYERCPGCDRQAHPYSQLCTINATGGANGAGSADCPAGFEWTYPSRFKPDLPVPIQKGIPEEQWLWLLPPFWGLVISVSLTWILHFLFKVVPVQGFFDRIQALPVSVLAKFGSQRMDLDVEGRIVAECMKGVKEPIKNPYAWPFLAFPFCIPWIMLPYYQDPFTPCPVKGGMPEWAFNFTIINSISTGCLMIVCAFFWKGRPGEEDGKGFGVAHAKDTDAIKFSDTEKNLQ